MNVIIEFGLLLVKFTDEIFVLLSRQTPPILQKIYKSHVRLSLSKLYLPLQVFSPAILVFPLQVFSAVPLQVSSSAISSSHL
jgi:hypothetical protein